MVHGRRKMVQLSRPADCHFLASFSHFRLLLFMMLVMGIQQVFSMSTSSSNTHSSLIQPHHFLCGNEFCDVNVGDAVVTRSLTGVSGELRDVTIPPDEQLRVLGRPASDDNTLWLVQWGDKKGLVNGDFLKELTVKDENHPHAYNLLKGRNPFFLDETKLGEHSPNMPSVIESGIHETEGQAPSIDTAKDSDLPTNTSEEAVLTENVAASKKNSESPTTDPQIDIPTNSGNTASISSPNEEKVEEVVEKVPDSSPPNPEKDQAEPTTIVHTNEEQRSNSLQSETTDSSVSSIMEETEERLGDAESNSVPEQQHPVEQPQEIVREPDHPSTTNDVKDQQQPVEKVEETVPEQVDASNDTGNKTEDVPDKKESLDGEQLLMTSSTLQPTAQDTLPLSDHPSSGGSMQCDAALHKTSVQECWLYISQQSAFFKKTFDCVQMLKQSIRHLLTMLPNSTVQQLEDMAHYAHLNVESLVLSVFMFLSLLPLLTLTRCCCVFRSDWRSLASRQRDQIIMAEEKLAEKDRLNASLTEWNTNLTKQIKCYENEITHLKSLTASRDNRMSKDLECSRDMLTQLESEAVRLRAQVCVLEQELSAANFEREEIVQRELEKSAILSAQHMKAMEEKEHRLKVKEGEIQEVVVERDDLREQVMSYYQQLNELKQELSDIERGRKSWENNVSMKEAEIENLKRSFQELKIFDREIEALLATNHTGESKKSKCNNDPSGWDFEDGDIFEQEPPSSDNHSSQRTVTEAMVKEKLDAFFSCSHLRSELLAEREKVAGLQDRLSSEHEHRKRLEDHLEELEKERLSLKETLRDSEEQRSASLNRLEILSQYFKEREVEYLVNVGKEVVEKGNTQQEYTNEKLRREVLEEELNMIREHVKTMKQELEESSRQYRKQLLQLEKRAHENWLNARSFEREVKELKEENAALRQKCYDNVSTAPKSFPALPGFFPPNLRMLGPPPYMPPFTLPPMFPPGMNTSATESLNESAQPRPGSRHSMQSEYISPVDNNSDRDWKPLDGDRRPVQRPNSRGGSLPPPVMLPPPHLLIRPPRLPVFNAPSGVPNYSTSDIHYSRN